MNKIILAKDLRHPKLGLITAGTSMEVSHELYASLIASGHISLPKTTAKADEEE